MLPSRSSFDSDTTSLSTMHDLGASQRPASSTSKRRPDITIAIMGPTGAGKSSLVQLVTGDQKIRIGHDVESETSEIGLARYFEPDGRCITFVDTPGFDDSREGITDAIILQQIATFLEAEYQDGKKLNGIIYMHRITDPRMGGVTARNLRMFRRLCGSESLKNVVVVTTRWDALVNETEGVQREKDLMNNPKFFQPLIDAGARFLRHNNTSESAGRIMAQLLGNDPIALQIQVEMSQGRKLSDTSAGAELGTDLSSLIRSHQVELENLRIELQTAMESKDETWTKGLEDERENLRKEMEKWHEEKRRLEESLDAVRAEALAAKEEAARKLEKERRDFFAMLQQHKEGHDELTAAIGREKAKVDVLSFELAHEKRRRAELEAKAEMERQVFQEKLAQKQYEADAEKAELEQKNVELQEELKRQCELNRRIAKLSLVPQVIGLLGAVLVVNLGLYKKVG